MSLEHDPSTHVGLGSVESTSDNPHLLSFGDRSDFTLNACLQDARSNKSLEKPYIVISIVLLIILPVLETDME